MKNAFLAFLVFSIFLAACHSTESKKDTSDTIKTNNKDSAKMVEPGYLYVFDSAWQQLKRLSGYDTSKDGFLLLRDTVSYKPCPNAQTVEAHFNCIIGQLKTIQTPYYIYTCPWRLTSMDDSVFITTTMQDSIQYFDSTRRNKVKMYGKALLINKSFNYYLLAIPIYPPMGDQLVFCSVSSNGKLLDRISIFQTEEPFDNYNLIKVIDARHFDVNGIRFHTKDYVNLNNTPYAYYNAHYLINSAGKFVLQKTDTVGFKPTPSK